MAVDVQKTLESAIANAETTTPRCRRSRRQAEASVGKALMMKRFHAACPWSSAAQIQKPFSRLRVVVREMGDEAENA